MDRLERCIFGTQAWSRHLVMCWRMAQQDGNRPRTYISLVEFFSRKTLRVSPHLRHQLSYWVVHVPTFSRVRDLSKAQQMRSSSLKTYTECNRGEISCAQVPTLFSAPLSGRRCVDGLGDDHALQCKGVL